MMRIDVVHDQFRTNVYDAIARNEEVATPGCFAYELAGLAAVKAEECNRLERGFEKSDEPVIDLGVRAAGREGAGANPANRAQHGSRLVAEVRAWIKVSVDSQI